MNALLKKSPCDECEDADSAKCWCEKYEAADLIIDLAIESIRALRFGGKSDKLPRRLHDELVITLADAYDNALYELGARLDTTEFTSRIETKERVK
jgi:hypothetical protein